MVPVLLSCLLGLTILAAASAADAAQPLVTDDAAVVAPRTCQVEAWVRSASDARDYAVQPACNPTGNLELAVGATRVRPDDDKRSSMVQLQAKTVLLPRNDGAWSFGVIAGALRDTGAPHGSSAFQAYYAKALASWYPNEDMEIDLNLGAANVYGSGTFTLAGAALQYTVTENLQLLAEMFRDEPGRGKYQVGVRYVAIPDRLEAYVSYGNRLNGPSSEWWVVAGIRLQTAPFLP
jgi:hypothetical protein